MVRETSEPYIHIKCAIFLLLVIQVPNEINENPQVEVLDFQKEKYKKNDACSKSKRTTGVFEELSLVVRWLEHWNAEAKNNDTIYVRVDTNEEDKLNMRIYIYAKRTVGGILRIE